jgi:HlyD family secretion protein
LPEGAGHAVFLVDGGRARQVSVTLGARSGIAAWIRDGLQPGQTVIVYPPATVADGVRVRERRV